MSKNVDEARFVKRVQGVLLISLVFRTLGNVRTVVMSESEKKTPRIVDAPFPPEHLMLLMGWYVDAYEEYHAASYGGSKKTGGTVKQRLTQQWAEALGSEGSTKTAQQVAKRIDLEEKRVREWESKRKMEMCKAGGGVAEIAPLPKWTQILYNYIGTRAKGRRIPFGVSSDRKPILDEIVANLVTEVSSTIEQPITDIPEQESDGSSQQQQQQPQSTYKWKTSDDYRVTEMKDLLSSLWDDEDPLETKRRKIDVGAKQELDDKTLFGARTPKSTATETDSALVTSRVCLVEAEAQFVAERLAQVKDQRAAAAEEHQARMLLLMAERKGKEMDLEEKELKRKLLEIEIEERRLRILRLQHEMSLRPLI